MSLEEESQGSAFARSDTSRVEAFSDSVLGIILTLLIFGIKTPQVEPGELLAGLLLQWPGYVAYLASFVYLAVIWLLSLIHISEPTRRTPISYAVFCLKKTT